MATTIGGLESARARWALMLLHLKAKGLVGGQLWPFPEDLSEAKTRFEFVKRYFRIHPESFGKGGLWDQYRLRLDEIMGYYAQEARTRVEKRMLTGTLVCSAVAALAGMVGIVGAHTVGNWITALVQMIRGAF